MCLPLRMQFDILRASIIEEEEQRQKERRGDYIKIIINHCILLCIYFGNQTLQTTKPKSFLAYYEL